MAMGVFCNPGLDWGFLYNESHTWNIVWVSQGNETRRISREAENIHYNREHQFQFAMLYTRDENHPQK